MGRSKKTDMEKPLFPDTEGPSHFIGIGASAGGLEAIESFFTNMPPQNTYGFIVIQHLSPDYKSLMVEILSKKTDMPVHRAENGMAVLPGHVYLIPPKKNLTIFHGKLLLSEQDHVRGINLPIDLFLRSLAEDQGEKSVAVILSGSGSDGMRGVREVKQYGGMIMVQDEESSKFDGMPRSAISTGLADFVMPPEEMPGQLVSFTQHSYNVKAGHSESIIGDEDGLTRIFSLLREKGKVDFTYYKPSTVTRRIERRMTVNQIDDIKSYVHYLQENQGEISTLFRELLIGVTNFFRDQRVFEKLEDEILSSLINSSEGRELRFWVAGCSTGEEAYSLAMLARESMEKAGTYRDIKIFATDIDREALRFAALGTYPESIAADLPMNYLKKYFLKKEDHFQISRTIREMVVFAQHNLIKDPPFTNIDLISCRNLLIYLQPVLQIKVLDFFNFSLIRGGVLLLGTSETIGEMGSFFETLDSKLKMYRSRGRSRQNVDSSFSSTATDTRYRELRGQYAMARRNLHASDEMLLERFLKAMSGEFLPAAVIVNENMEILHVIGNSENFFRFPTGKPTMEIDKIAVKELKIPLSTGVQRVFHQRKKLLLTGIQLKSAGDKKMVDLHILPMPEKKGQSFLAAVLIQDAVRPAAGGKTQAVLSYDLSKEAEQRINDLEQELQFSRENLQATIEELETSNEELQATNEELLASNEELQSTNEELQSTNEELYTVNTEYHNKIIELTELNNDVDNLLEASLIGKLLLDENLEIRRYSKRIASIFKILEGDIGRPISHLSHRLVGSDPVKVMEEVAESGTPQEREVHTEEGEYYLMRVVPYTVGPEVFSGIVASFIDISSTKTTQQALRQSESLFNSLIDASPALVWMSGPDRQRVWFNQPWLRFTGKSLEEEIGNGWTVGVHPEDFEPYQAKYNAAFDKRGVFRMEFRLKQHDGEYRWIIEEGHPLYDADDVFKGYIGSCLDITERKIVEEDLRKREQDIEKLLLEKEIEMNGCCKDE